MPLADMLAKGPAMPPEPAEDDGGLEAAAGEFMAAVKRGDAPAVASAFRAMHEICAGYEE